MGARMVSGVGRRTAPGTMCAPCPEGSEPTENNEPTRKHDSPAPTWVGKGTTGERGVGFPHFQIATPLPWAQYPAMLASPSRRANVKKGLPIWQDVVILCPWQGGEQFENSRKAFRLMPKGFWGNWGPKIVPD